MLSIQKYLRTDGNSLETLGRDYAISGQINETLGIVVLNYSQYASPMSETICQESRTLILELDTWEIVCRSFFKFFNYDEPLAANIDWNTSTIYEKLDGSLINVYFYQDQWRIATSARSDASGPVGESDTTYRELFIKALSTLPNGSWEKLTQGLNQERFYAFELMTPENINLVLVKVYSVFLLAGWDKSTLDEIPTDSLLEVPSFIPRAPKFHIRSFDEVVSRLKSKTTMETEGFVICDGSFNRIKMKTGVYIRANRLNSRLTTPWRKIEAILGGDLDDILGILPTSVINEINDITAKIAVLRTNALQEYAQILLILPKGATRKDFAAIAKRTPYPGWMFALYDGGNINEILQIAGADNLAKMIGIESDLDKETNDKHA